MLKLTLQVEVDLVALTTLMRWFVILLGFVT